MSASDLIRDQSGRESLVGNLMLREPLLEKQRYFLLTR